MISTLPKINHKIAANTKLILQLSLKNTSNENLLFRPNIEDWIIDNTEIVSSSSTINPAYTYLSPQAEINQTIILQIPPNLYPGQTLKNCLRFPGVQEESIPINLEIVEIDSQPNLKEGWENVFLSLSIKLPFSSEFTNLSMSDENSHSHSIFALMSGIIDLDKIPSRWLVAELCVKLCQIGETYGASEQGIQLLNQLKSTDVFKNGVMAFASAKIPEWIAQTTDTISKTLGGKSEESHLLYIWESWLFSLAGIDLEIDLTKYSNSSYQFSTDEFIQNIGLSSEPWFAGIVLGLANLSPQIETKLIKIINSQNNQSNLNNNTHQATISLMTGLPGLDFIPVRWLVIEILLRIARIGNQYAQTEEGEKLINCLSHTRFFKNGTLAFASAQVPRWIDISQLAMTAYYNSLGVQTSNHGLLDLWETWLWSLAAEEVETSLIHGEIKIPNPTIEIFIKDLGMDETSWFTAIVLGLGKVSPRIYQRLEEISQKTDNLVNQTTFFSSHCNDVIAETGSMQI